MIGTAVKWVALAVLVPLAFLLGCLAMLSGGGNTRITGRA